MASSTRTRVEQDLTQHTLGHIFTKLRGRLSAHMTFVVVEGSDDLAFYSRFFDNSTTSMYYSTKMTDDGTVTAGGCPELESIVRKVLKDGRTEKVLGIMDTDFKKFRFLYRFPRHVFHTDYRDMEMTALSTPSVKLALSLWIKDYEKKWTNIKPILRHVGVYRIVNNIFGLGCNFKKKCKVVACVFDESTHRFYPDWEDRFNRKFRSACLQKKDQSLVGRVKTLFLLEVSRLFLLFFHYEKACDYDICQGHDTIKLLSLSLINIATYSVDAIWEKCFDAYTKSDFKNTALYSSLCAWQAKKGAHLFNDA